MHLFKRDKVIRSWQLCVLVNTDNRYPAGIISPQYHQSGLPLYQMQTIFGEMLTTVPPFFQFNEPSHTLKYRVRSLIFAPSSSFATSA